MIEWGTEAYIQGVRFVSIPVQTLSIANVLNGMADSKGYVKSSGAIRFTSPSARLLVVDDIATNLRVVEGLLAPYKAEVDTCLSGAQAIELVKRTTSQKREYDIVFMDHMMPEMDGIETTAAIRAWEKDQRENGVIRKQVPIIALTANAVVGMREMFIENGFNDFLSKPIDVFKLDEILDRWIPGEKRDAQESTASSGVNEIRQHSESPRNGYSNKIGGLALARPAGDGMPIPIPGIDITKGIAMTGGKLDTYRHVLSIFCDDAEKRLPLLQTVPEANALSAFVTQVHALKSASASIGAAEVSAVAAGLEAVGKAGDTAFIGKQLPYFAGLLTKLVAGIRGWEKAMKERDSGKPPTAERLDHETVMSLLHELAAALKSQKADDIDRILENLMAQPLDAAIKKAVEQISDAVLMAEYDKAVEILDNVLTM
jgi:CheY-like chemotaxis protein